MVHDRPQVLAQKNYLQHRKRLEAMKTLEERFIYIYENNLWGGTESRSGLGSALDERKCCGAKYRLSWQVLVRRRSWIYLAETFDG